MRVAPRSLIVTVSVSATIVGGARGVAFDRAGAGHVADGAKAHLRRLDRLAGLAAA